MNLTVTFFPVQKWKVRVWLPAIKKERWTSWFYEKVNNDVEFVEFSHVGGKRVSKEYPQRNHFNYEMIVFILVFWQMS